MTHLLSFTCTADRFRNAQIEVAENNTWRPCGIYNGPGVPYQIIFIICNEVVRGDLVKITLQTIPGEKTALSVCEVEVFEEAKASP
jgi:hypothetical protein